jgi:hypothetical protein
LDQQSSHLKQDEADLGISVSDFIDELLAKWWLVLSLLALGLALGVATALVLPKRWDAVALVQIGQVGQLTPISNEPGNSNQPPSLTFPIESSARAAERVRDRAFLKELLEFQKLPTGDDWDRSPEARLIRDSLRVSVPRATELLEIHVSGYSPEVARSNAAAVLSVLGRAHLRIMEPSLVRLKSQHQTVQSELAESIKERARLEELFSALRGASKQRDRVSESVLTGFLISLKQREIQTLTERKLHIEEQLSPGRTFQTASLTAIFVPARPSFPSRLIFGLAGGGIALIGAFAWILLRRSRRAPT